VEYDCIYSSIYSLTCGDTVIFIVRLEHWYLIFFVRLPPDVISLQVCNPKVDGV
jgi:hypothetical protein